MGLKVWSRFCEKILRNRKPHNFLSAKFYDDKVDAMQKVSRSSSHHREEINSVVMKMRKLFLSIKVENLNSYLLFPFSFSKEYQGFLKKLHLVFSFKITFLIKWFLNISASFLGPHKVWDIESQLYSFEHWKSWINEHWYFKNKLPIKFFG